jgi:LysM domain
MAHSDENFHPESNREQAARADAPTHDNEKEQVSQPLRSAALGDIIPSERETHEATDSASELFHQATGLDKIPAPGTATYSVKLAEMQAQRAEGVSRAQNIAFTNAGGETIVGAQFTKSDGTFFKTMQGDTYKVQANDQGGFALDPVRGSREKFVATDMQVLPDAFGLKQEYFSQRTVRPPGDGTVVHSAGAELNFAPQLQGHIDRQEMLPAVHQQMEHQPVHQQLEHQHQVETHMAAQQQLEHQHLAAQQQAESHQPVREVNPAERADLGRGHEGERAASGGVFDLLSQVVGEIVAKLNMTFGSATEGKNNGIREVAAALEDYKRRNPQLGGVPALAEILTRHPDVPSSLDAMMGRYGSRAQSIENISGSTFNVQANDAFENALRQMRANREGDRAARVDPISHLAQELGAISGRHETRVENIVIAQPTPMAFDPNEIAHKATEQHVEIEQFDDALEPAAQAVFEEVPIPAEAPHVEPDETAEVIAQNLALEQQTKDRSQQEELENEEEERKKREDQDRLEREAIKLRIQKREEERRKRYLVKEKDTLESIAVKQLRDVRLAALIFDINKHLIPVKVVRGKPTRELKPRMIIFLPTNAEIDKYRGLPAPPVGSELIAMDTIAGVAALAAGTTFGAEGSDEGSEVVSPLTPDQRENVENLLGELPNAPKPDEVSSSKFDEALQQAKLVDAVFSAHLNDEAPKPEIKIPTISPVMSASEAPAGKVEMAGSEFHTVRLGDTLKSLAMRHPKLSDVSLWALLAEVNSLPTTVDSKGAPEVKLVRGSRIRIPSADEIVQFRSRKD